MTQQSLITRLKAVEEALQNGAAALESEACSYKEDFGGCSFFNHTSYEEMIQEAKEAKTALSDLRELIKEAELQEQFGVWHSADDPDESDFFLGDAVDALDCDRCKPLYTALGEKP